MTVTGIHRALVRGIRMTQAQLRHPLVGDKLLGQETMVVQETGKQAEMLRQVEHLTL